MTAKRILDITGAALGLMILSPVLVVIALVLKCEGGPVIFRQQRVGQYGRPFELLKFRTMHLDAERTGPPITIGDDARVTRIGRYLRHTKLDESLQLVNVLRGQMSLVGPRPEIPRYLDLDSAMHTSVLELLPGITDPASIRFSNEAELLAAAEDPENFYRENILPMKQQLSLKYAGQANVISDIVILASTLAVVIRAGRKWNGRGRRLGDRGIFGCDPALRAESVGPRPDTSAGER